MPIYHKKVKAFQTFSANSDGLVFFVPFSEIVRVAEEDNDIRVTDVADFVAAVEREATREYYSEDEARFVSPIGQFMRESVDVAVNDENCRGFEDAQTPTMSTHTAADVLAYFASLRAPQYPRLPAPPQA